MSVLSPLQNKYLQHFVTGLAIGIGIAAFSHSFFFFKDILEDDPMFEGRSSDVDLKFLRFVTIGRKLNITALIKNNTNQHLRSVDIIAELYDEIGIFGTCRWHYLDISPAEERQVSIKCLNFEPDKIPQNTAVKLRVGYVDLE